MTDNNGFDGETRLGAYRYVKRFLDIVGSLLALIVFSPVFLVLSLLIKNRDGGSAFLPRKESVRAASPS
jgi:lipopolysaccharide/colanic/teichoic acid biosynthesis glycosyltransferase